MEEIKKFDKVAFLESYLLKHKELGKRRGSTRRSCPAN